MSTNVFLESGMLPRPEGKEVLGASAVPPNALEASVLRGLDVDKLNQLAEGLFVLNNRHYGPIPGSYMVVCTKPETEWCVGQLNADRAKPLILFEDKVFPSSALALAEAGTDEGAARRTGAAALHLSRFRPNFEVRSCPIPASRAARPTAR